MLVCACLATLGVFGQSPSGKATTVALPENFYPLSYRDANGQPTGFIPDFTRAVAKEAGLELNIVLTPDDYSAPLPPSSRASQADVVLAPQNAPVAGQYKAYVIEVQYSLFVRSDQRTKFDSLANLANLKGLVAIDSAWGESYAVSRGVAKDNVLHMPAEEALKRLDAKNGVDAVLVADYVGTRLIRKNDLQQVISSGSLPAATKRYELVVPRDHDDLRGKISVSTMKVVMSGLPGRLNRKYRLSGGPDPISGEDVAWAISAALSIALLIGLTFVTVVMLQWRKIARQANALMRSRGILSAAQALGGVGHWQREDLPNDSASGAFAPSIQRIAQFFGRTANKKRGVDEPGVMCSDQLCRIAGMPLGTDGTKRLSSVDFINLVHEDDRELLREAMRSAQYTGKPVTLNHRVVQLNGEQRFVEHCVQYVSNGNGQDTLVLVGTVQDITKRKQEEELRDNQARALREAGEIAKLGGWSFDPHTGEGQWTPEVAAIHELPPDHATSREIGLSFFQGEHRARIEAALYEATTKGTPYDLELELLTAKGNRRWVRTICNPVVENGAVIRVRGCIQDITDRKLAAAALQHSDDVLKKLSAQAPGLIYIFQKSPDDTLTLPFVSQSIAQFFEVTAEQAHQDAGSVFARVVPQDLPHIMELIDESARKLTPFRSEYRVQLPKSGLRWHRAESQPELLQDGTVIWHGYITDFTERKQAENRITEQAEFLDKANDAILVRDMNHRVIYWNQGAANLYGWTAQEAIGRHVNELIYPASGLPEKAHQSMLDCGEWKGEVEQMAKDGRDLTVEARWTLMRDEDGNPHSVLAINTDITEKKRLETRFIRSQRLESIGTLASGLAHDLNNVLAPITLAVSLLRDKAVDPMTSKTLDIIDTAALRGASVVKQIVGFARGSSVARVPIQIESLVADQAERCRQVFPPNISIHHTVKEEAWTMQGDAVQLQQLITNLCQNARDAMAENGGTLTLSVTNHWLESDSALLPKGAKPGPHLLLEVADTGTGIAPELLPRIFDPFFTSKDVGRGSGLGLSTVMGIVRGHNGFIDVASQIDKGTTVQVFLPASETPAANLDFELEPAAAVPQGSGQTLLLVDDEVPLRQLMAQLLEKHGYKVQTAGDGIEAVALYAREHRNIALIITDMAMPRMGGEGAIRAVRRIKPDMPIIAVSGNRDPNTINHIAPGLHFLSKPFSPEALLRTVGKALGIEGSSTATAAGDQ